MMEEAVFGRGMVKQAIGILVSIGSEEAKEIMFEAAQYKKFKKDKHGLRLFESGIKMINIQNELELLDASEKVALLKKEFDENVKRKHGGSGVYSHWLINKLESMDDSSVVDLLKKIWQNESLDFHLRYKAQNFFKI